MAAVLRRSVFHRMISYAFAGKQVTLASVTTAEGFWNGRMWASMPTLSKVSYITGMSDGVSQYRTFVGLLKCCSPAILQACADTMFHSEIKSHFQIRDVTKAMDRLYDDPANLNLPVFEIYQTAMDRLAGTKSSVTENALDELRSHYNKEK